jgi:hypothetical protein
MARNRGNSGIVSDRILYTLALLAIVGSLIVGVALWMS